MIRSLKIALIILLVTFQSVCLAQDKKPKLREILKKEGICDFEVEIHDQNKDWLIENFGKGSTPYQVNINLMLRNIIWQQRQLRRKGEKPPFYGHIRGFWYAYIKGTLV